MKIQLLSVFFSVLIISHAAGQKVINSTPENLYSKNVVEKIDSLNKELTSLKKDLALNKEGLDLYLKVQESQWDHFIFITGLILTFLPLLGYLTTKGYIKKVKRQEKRLISEIEKLNEDHLSTKAFTLLNVGSLLETFSVTIQSVSDITRETDLYVTPDKICIQISLTAFGALYRGFSCKQQVYETDFNEALSTTLAHLVKNLRNAPYTSWSESEILGLKSSWKDIVTLKEGNMLLELQNHADEKISSNAIEVYVLIKNILKNI